MSIAKARKGSFAEVKEILLGMGVNTCITVTFWWRTINNTWLCHNEIVVR